MYKYSIGFRMKFDDIKSEDIEKVVTDYLEKFDRYEIKVTKNIISSGKISVLLNVSEKIAKSKFSLHLPKDVLSNKESYDETIKFIEILSHYRSTNKVYLIAHIPHSNYRKFLDRILNISERLPNNYVLLLENEKTSNNNEYLKQINKICYLLIKNKINNTGICLDIGHLLFGFYEEGIVEEEALSQLKKMTNIVYKIEQIHIHDYLKTDHLPLKKGIMNIDSISKFIIENDLKVPIIIESTVKKPEQDGIKQVSILNQSLKGIKEMKL